MRTILFPIAALLLAACSSNNDDGPQPIDYIHCGASQNCKCKAGTKCDVTCEPGTPGVTDACNIVVEDNANAMIHTAYDTESTTTISCGAGAYCAVEGSPAKTKMVCQHSSYCMINCKGGEAELSCSADMEECHIAQGGLGACDIHWR